MKASTARLVLPAMVASPYTSSGVQINGIVPAEEQVMTHLDSKITTGDYFTTKTRFPIILSEKLAHKLSVKLRSKVVVTFQDKNNNILAGAFRVVALYKTNNGIYDDQNVFVRRKDVQDILGDSEIVNEIAIKMKDASKIEDFISHYQSRQSDVLIESWADLAPELELFSGALDQGMQIFVTIILLALAFGIVNTMLMAVLERVREIGMLMAIGMNKKRIFLMIMLETIFLSVTGAPLGLLLSWLSVLYFGNYGIDLSVVAEGLESLGYSSIVYPEVEFQYYYNIVIQVIIIAILASIYPARKALSLNPVEAIQ